MRVPKPKNELREVGRVSGDRCERFDRPFEESSIIVLAWKFKFTKLLRCARRQQGNLQGTTFELQISAVKCH